MYVKFVAMNEIYNILLLKKIQSALYRHEVKKMTKNLVFWDFFQCFGTIVYQKYIMCIFIRKLKFGSIK